MNISDTSSSVEELVDETLNLCAKGFGGGFKTVGDLASPEKYLYWQFPDWKFGNKTVMIPAAYMPSKLGYTTSRDGKYVHEDDSNVRGMQGEKLVYDRLQHVGRAKNTGMFVIHGFQLIDISTWNDRCERESIESVVPVPKIPTRKGESDSIIFRTEDVKRCERESIEDVVPKRPKISTLTGESDFIIFHHTKGVILIEVKNLKESDNNIQESASLPKETEGSEAAEHSNDKMEEKNDEIDKAKDQLKKSRKVVKAFAETNSSCSEQADELEPFPIVMFIALPSTRKGAKHKHKEEMPFIYEEDLRAPESFSKWWTDNIETLPLMPTTLETQKAYELALSRMLAVRHLGPVTESEYTANTSHILDSFKHLDNLAKHFRRIRESEHPHLFRWCKDISQLDLPAAKVSIKETCDALRSVNIIAAQANLIKVLNKHLSGSKFITGEESAPDDTKVFQYLSQEYIMDIDCIVRFMNRVTEFEAQKTPEKSAAGRTLKDFNLHVEETEDIGRLNQLSKLLDRNHGGFLEGEHCTKLDVELRDKLAKGNIRVLPLAGKTPLAPVFTMEQLAVFEGPRKQLIIGGPGSGKTELMKAKALTLSQQTKGGKRILYLIQLPDKKSVIPNVMAKFFQDNKAKNVDVATIQLDGEKHDVFESVHLVKIQQEQEGDKHEISGSQWSQFLEMYSHVFIDELWIGSKIRHEMEEDGTIIKKVDELEIAKQAIENIEGYVWMTSVFDFKDECFPKISDEEIRLVLESRRFEGKGNLLYKTLGTPSLLDTLRRNGGVTCRIKHPLRSTNNIVKLLQDYSSRYLERDFPYGTENMLNHNVEGQEISWIVAQPQSLVASSGVHELEQDEQWQLQKNELAMQTYSKCAEVIEEALYFHADLRPPSLMKTSKSQVKLQLCPGDILVVNFIARYQSKLSLGKVLERNEIPFYDLREQGVFSACCLDRSHSGVFLLNSLSRDDSTCLDGAEWPMVIILLTPELMLSEGSARFETVRNYDPYIAMFRAQAKLVVISDTWTSSQDFLDSVDKKSR